MFLFRIKHFMFHSQDILLTRQRSRITSIALCWLAILVAPGCSKEDVKKMAATVQQKTQSIADSTKKIATQAVETVEEQLPETGQFTLQVSPPVEIATANIAVISIGDGRKNVVQIASYDASASPKSYPCVLIQGQTDAGDPASLAGQTIACELYMQASSGAPLAMTSAGQPAQVTFRSFDPEKKTIAARIDRVPLIASDNTTISLGGGSIVAVIAGGGS